jgi:hypothetical protein
MGQPVGLTARRVDLRRRRIEVVEAITEVHGRAVVGSSPERPVNAWPA